MRKTKKVSIFVALLLLSAVAGLPAQAQRLPGKHPGYLRALAYLRTARWLLNHQPGDAKVYAGEDVALQQVTDAIGDIHGAAIDDGKDINDHLRVDASDKGSRLLRAIENLHMARHEIEGEEDDPAARGLRHLCFDHIDKALQAASRAHDAWVVENNRSRH